MNCLKCGREMESGDAFCPVCQERMKRYPVKSGTAVVLPSRKDPQNIRRQPPRKRTPSAEEQVALLKRHNQRLAGILVLCVLIIALLGVISGYAIQKLGMQKLLGQNYSTFVQTEPSEEASGSPESAQTQAGE